MKPLQVVQRLVAMGVPAGVKMLPMTIWPSQPPSLLFRSRPGGQRSPSSQPPGVRRLPVPAKRSDLLPDGAEVEICAH